MIEAVTFAAAVVKKNGKMRVDWQSTVDEIVFFHILTERVKIPIGLASYIVSEEKASPFNICHNLGGNRFLANVDVNSTLRSLCYRQSVCLSVVRL